MKIFQIGPVLRGPLYHEHCVHNLSCPEAVVIVTCTAAHFTDDCSSLQWARQKYLYRYSAPPSTWC